MEIIYTPRGCPLDKYKFKMMEEFNATKHKHEPLSGHYVYVKRESPTSPIKVFKTLDDHDEIRSNVLNTEMNGPVFCHYIYYNDDDITHRKKDLYNYHYDESIKVQYLGTNVNLNISQGEYALIQRQDNGELFVLYKNNKFDNEFVKIFADIKAPTYLHYEQFDHLINSVGNVEFLVHQIDWL